MRRPILAAATAVSVLALAACGTARTGESTTALLAAPSATSSPASPAAPVTCNDQLQSYAPGGITAADADVRKIKDRGRLIAGVSADTLQLGARDPQDNQIKGFDTDMARYVAKAIFNDPTKVEFRVITAAERVPLLKDGSVDIVARAMTMTCARWKDIAFSSQYYEAGQKIMVRSGATARTFAQIRAARQKVCVQPGTTTLKVATEKVGEDLIVTAPTATDCLVLFQQGDVSAVTSDDTILAGLTAQDRYAEVAKGAPLSEEPYGLGVAKDRVGLVRFVNKVLADVRTDGRWEQSYRKWLEPELGPASPPKPQYGR